MPSSSTAWPCTLAILGCHRSCHALCHAPWPRRGNATALDMRRQLIQLGKVAEQLHATWSARRGTEPRGRNGSERPAEGCGMLFINSSTENHVICRSHIWSHQLHATWCNQMQSEQPAASRFLNYDDYDAFSAGLLDYRVGFNLGIKTHRIHRVRPPKHPKAAQGSWPPLQHVQVWDAERWPYLQRALRRIEARLKI